MKKVTNEIKCSRIVQQNPKTQHHETTMDKQESLDCKIQLKM